MLIDDKSYDKRKRKFNI